MESCVPLELGANLTIDTGVLLGYRPGRPVELRAVRIGAGAWLRSGTVIYAAVEIGASFETGHNVVIREENRIGDNCSVWNNATIDYGCVIGHRVRVHCNVYLAQYTVIEDDVFVAPGVTVANDLHPMCTKCMQGPIIRAGARIGINATLLPHIEIGENSLVAAGSVVTKDVPARAVVRGFPARVVAEVDNLKCAFDLVTPYVEGIDVKRRPEWENVAALQRPMRRPDRRNGQARE